MEEFIAQQYFSDVKRCKYIFEYHLRRNHSFSSLKASIANKCSVDSTNLHFEGTEYLVLQVIWTKPHYFIINTKTYNIMWIEGRICDDVKFKRLYTVITSLSNWIHTLQALAEEEIINIWVEYGHYIKATSARKKLGKLGLLHKKFVHNRPVESKISVSSVESSRNVPVVEYAIVLHDYEGDSVLLQLDLKKGDKIEVIKKTDSGWWTGILNGKKGLFPINFVQVQ